MQLIVDASTNRSSVGSASGSSVPGGLAGSSMGGGGSSGGASSSVPGTPRKLFGYKVLAFLGEGAAASVYSVQDPMTGNVYALKHVTRKDDKSHRFIEQLYNEFEVGKKLSHPNIRKPVDLKVTRSMLLFVTEAALVMELLDARPMDTLAEQFGVLSEEKSEGQHAVGSIPLTWSLGILLQAARGLAAINSAGMVHCDIKPSNIMVPNEPGKQVVKVIDLGQCCATGTVKKRIQGSPYFISPEQYKREPATPRTDVFNFGATLYWALTGRHVPTVYTNAKGLTRTSTEKAPAPHKVRPEVPKELSTLTMECLRTRPTERPESMSAVANRLGLILRDFERNAAVA